MNALALPFAAILGEAILAVEPLAPGYDGHANDVWQVTTASRTVVLRMPRPGMGDTENPFWAGARLLFDHDPRDLTAIGPLHDHLRNDLGLPAPCVLASGAVDEQPWLVAERLPGVALQDLTTAPNALLAELGRWLTRLHGDVSTTWGDLVGRRRESLCTFPARLQETVVTLTRRFHPGDPAFDTTLRDVTARIAAMPTPAYAAPIMLDVDPTQFLYQGNRLTGLIDTDAVVFGPPELELVALEPLLDARSATAFRSGYGPLPDLDTVRPIYRFLALLMEVQGDVPLSDWMQSPHWLSDEEDRQ